MTENNLNSNTALELANRISDIDDLLSLVLIAKEQITEYTPKDSTERRIYLLLDNYESSFNMYMEEIKGILKYKCGVDID